MHSTSDGGSLYKLGSLEIPVNGGDVKLPFRTCTPSVSIATVKHIYVIVEYSCCLSDDKINRIKSTTKTRRIRLRLSECHSIKYRFQQYLDQYQRRPPRYICVSNCKMPKRATQHTIYRCCWRRDAIRGIFMIASKWSQG